MVAARTRSIRSFMLAVLAAIFLVAGLTTAASADVLGSEPPDFQFPDAPTFAAQLGSHTVRGSLGPTPDDGQDPFNVTIPATLNVVSVSYSGPGGPHNLVGCGLTGTGNLNQTFTNQSNCALSWFINTNFATGSSPWTVTIVTETRPGGGDTTPPVVTVPADIVVGTDAGVASAVVSFVASASDNVDGSVAVSCDPVSGSTFSVGTTTVACSATDAAGNVGQASFGVTVVDDEAPHVTVPADIVVGTDAGVASAVVSFVASASDNVDGSVAVSCDPVSGSTFSVGTTTVACSATDAAGNVGQASFGVTVVDDEAPVVTVPATIERTATSSEGAVVDFDASASDNVDGSVAVSCDPVSGSTFSLGTTTVACSATDAAGNVGQASFDLVVRVAAGPAGIQILVDDIESAGYSRHVERSLVGRLGQAGRLLADANPSNDGAVCGMLGAFTDQVAELVTEGALSVDQAQVLTTYADALRSGLWCE